MTRKTKGWPVNSPFSLDSVHWPAIISSPAMYCTCVNSTYNVTEISLRWYFYIVFGGKLLANQNQLLFRGNLYSRDTCLVPRLSAENRFHCIVMFWSSPWVNMSYINQEELTWSCRRTETTSLSLVHICNETLGGILADSNQYLHHVSCKTYNSVEILTG